MGGARLMAYAIVDDAFGNHPKVVALIFHPTADGPRALAYWLMALSWANRYTIDKPPDQQGLIPPEQLRAWGQLMHRETEAAEALADVALWDRLPGGYYRIHDFRYWARAEQRESRVRGGRMTANKRWGTELPLDDNRRSDSSNSSATSSNGSSATSSPGSSATEAASSSAVAGPGGQLIGSGSYTNTNTKTNTKEDQSQNLSAADAADFDRFWPVYPRRTGKQAARKAFLNAVSGKGPHQAPTSAQVIIDAAVAYADAVGGRDLKFVPHPATWLNQGRWDDDLPEDGPQVIERGTFE
jgi:hypothetical protein